MEIAKLIIRVCARTNAANVACAAEIPEKAVHELSLLRDLLNNESQLEAGGVCESSKSSGG